MYKLEKEWGTFTDVRNGWSVPRSTSYLRLKDGTFKSKIIGGRRLIHLDSVREYFENASGNYKSSRLRLRQMKHAAKASVKKRKQKAERGTAVKRTPR
jgi:hypothetical protein